MAGEQAIHNSQWSSCIFAPPSPSAARCSGAVDALWACPRASSHFAASAARKLACGTPCFIGLTSRCFAHRARASCVPRRTRHRGRLYREKAPYIARLIYIILYIKGALLAILISYTKLRTMSSDHRQAQSFVMFLRYTNASGRKFIYLRLTGARRDVTIFCGNKEAI